MPAHRLAPLDRLIAALRSIWLSEPDIETRMRGASPILQSALADRELLAHSKTWPLTVGQNLLFYEDPEFGFVINATVRPAGSRGTVHDHAHSWTLYGLLDGTEQLERYQRVDDGTRPGHAELKLLSDTTLKPGMIDFVAPYEIHAERGGDGRSVAVIIRSERLVGRTLQRGFDPASRTVRDMSGPTQISFDLVRLQGHIHIQQLRISLHARPVPLPSEQRAAGHPQGCENTPSGQQAELPRKEAGFGDFLNVSVVQEIAMDGHWLKPLFHHSVVLCRNSMRGFPPYYNCA